MKDKGSMKSKRERVKKTRLSIEDRVKILERLENGENNVTLAHEYKVSAPTIANIKKDKEKLLKCKNALVTFQGKIKKGYTGIGNIFLDQYLYNWFVRRKRNGKHVTGSMIQQKALEINRTLNGPKSFKASPGFLWNFTKRHNIKLSCHNKRYTKKDGKEYLDQDSSNNFDRELIEDSAEQEQQVSNDEEFIKSEHQIKNELNENDEMERVKKTRLSIEDRVKILERLEKGENNVTLAHEYKVSAPTIANIKKDKEKLLKCKNALVMFQGKIKIGYTGIGNIFLDQYLYKWFVRRKRNGKHVTGSMIQQKALEINKILNGPKSFKASPGFLWNFTKRHNIKLSCHNKKYTKKNGNEYLDQDSSNNFDQELIEDNSEQEQRISNDAVVIKYEHQINDEIYENNEMERVKKTRLSIEDRVKILERLQNGEKSVTLAHEYKISAPTIANIKKDKEKLLKCKNALITFQGKIKKGYTGIGKIFLDQYLYKWFVRKKRNGKRVTGSMIQQKALEINRTLNGPKSFKASPGFLWNFTKRHNIKLCHNKRYTKKDGKEYLDQGSSNNFDQELIENDAEQEQRVSNDEELIKSEHQINNELNENNEIERVKKTRLSIEDRVKILERLENGENIVTLAHEYKVSAPTIASIKKDKEKLLKCKNALVTFQGKIKKGYTGIGNIFLDQYLYKWFVQTKKNGKHVTGSMIQQKALEINRTLNGPKSFKASPGFLWNFTKRHNIKLSYHNKRNIKKDGKEYLDQGSSNNFDQELIENNAEQGRVSNNEELIKSEHQINNELNENNEMERVKKTRLSIEDRVKILERLNNGEKSVTLAHEYKISAPTIANIKKDKEKLLKCKNVLVTFQGKIKKGYTGIGNIFLDQYLYNWFVRKEKNGKHVTGSMIQQKALEINRTLNGPKSFKASPGFLWNFTKRHNIKLSCHNKRYTKKDGKEYLDQGSSNNFDQELIEDNSEQEQRISNDAVVIKYEHQINDELYENNETLRDNEHLNDSNHTDDITAINAFNAISTFLSWYKTHGNGSPEDWQSLRKFWQYSLDQVAYNKC